MAVELELVIRFERDGDVPSQEELEDQLECVCIEYVREEV